MRTVEIGVGAEAAKPVLLATTTTLSGASHNYWMSHDGRKWANFIKGGVRLYLGTATFDIKGALSPTARPELEWSPDSRFLAYFADGNALRVIDTAAAVPTVTQLVTVADPRWIHEFKWAPQGATLYWTESAGPDTPYELKCQSVGSTEARRLFRSPKPFFVMTPPHAWFAAGTDRATQIGAFVDGETFFLIGQDGKSPAKKVCAVRNLRSIRDFAWSVAGDALALDISRGPKISKGIQLIHLKDGAESEREQLHPGGDIHTMWFSRKGGILSWATESAVWFRKKADRGKPAKKVPEAEAGLAIKGFSWNQDESLLAITAGPQVWIYDPATNLTKRIRSLGDAPAFCAEPRWRGDRLVVTIFEDCASSGEKPKATEVGDSGLSVIEVAKPK